MTERVELDGRWLDEALAAARARFGLANLSAASFAGEVAIRRGRRLGHDAEGAALGHVDGADLALAIACDLGLPESWETLIAHYTVRLTGLLQRRGARAEEAERTVSELWGELALPPPRDAFARTRLGTYGGSSSLGTWLSVVLLRRRADRLRERHQTARPLDEPHGTSDPVRTVEQSEEAAIVRTVITASWRELPRREALALALRHGHGVALDRIARVLEVGVPRASRIVRRAEERLSSVLSRRLGAARSDVDPVVWAAELGAFLANQTCSDDSPAARYEDLR